MNIGKLFSKSARIFPDRLAITHGDYEVTYKEANERINRLANGFRSLGIKKGDNVAIIMHNCPEYIETLYACFKAGLGAVPLNFRLHPKECSFIIDNSDTVCVVLSKDFRDPLFSLKNEMRKVNHYVCTSEPLEGMTSYQELIQGNAPVFVEENVNRDDLAWLFYTSGTTGNPKGAMLTHHNLLTMSMNFFADVSPLGPEDVILHAAPLSHGSGLYSIPNVAKGATNVILPSKSFDPKIVFETIQRRGVTNIFMAPAMIKRLITDPSIEKYDLSSGNTDIIPRRNLRI